MAMRDTPDATRDPLPGAELRQAARFAMTLVEEQARVCQRLIRLVDLAFPELGEVFDDPTCRTAREVLRTAPTAGGNLPPDSTLANSNNGPGHRRLGSARAERLQAAAGSIAVPELEAEVGLRDRPPARPARPARTPDRGSRPPRRVRARLGACPSAPDDPGRRALDRRHAHRRDRRHHPVRRLRPAPRVCRGPPGRAQLRAQGIEPGDRLTHEQGRQHPPAGRRLPDGPRRHPAQPGHRRPLRPESCRRQVEDERPRPMHAQGARHRLGRLAQRDLLRPRLGGSKLDGTLWI